MSDWNEERSIYKAKKVGQIDAKQVRGGRGKKKPKPWRVMTMFSFGPASVRREYVAYRGESEEACKAWIEKRARSYYIRRQDNCERAHKTAQQHAQERAALYWIVGPEGDK